MAILITGDRNWTEYQKIESEILKHNPECLILGDCRGVDTLAKKVAIKYNINYVVLKADWNKYGTSAGPIRNKQMIEILVARHEEKKLVLAFHPNIELSKGTKSCLTMAKKYGLDHILIELSYIT
jgi:hypothetical protein